MADDVAHQQAPVVVGQGGEQRKGHAQNQTGHEQALLVALVVSKEPRMGASTAVIKVATEVP